MTRMLQEAFWMRSLDAEMAMLGDAERSYVTFFCAMTLYYPPAKTWVYHAACLKLDRSFVLRQLGLQKKKEESKELLWPAVLMEGTAYTTGCWQYEPRDEDQASKLAFRFAHGEVFSKETVQGIRKLNLYGHIQSLFSPELVRSHGILQIELGYKNKKTAPVEVVMQYDDASVSWHPIVNTGAYEQVKKLKTLAFPLTPLPRMPPGFKPKRINLRAVSDEPEIDCCVRAVDWNQTEIERELDGTSLDGHFVKLTITRDLSLIHVLK